MVVSRGSEASEPASEPAPQPWAPMAPSALELRGSTQSATVRVPCARRGAVHGHGAQETPSYLAAWGRAWWPPQAGCVQAHAMHSERAAAHNAAVPPAGLGWTWTEALERQARPVHAVEPEL